MANCKHCNDELTYILVESKETVYYNLTKDGDIEHDGSENESNGSLYLCPSCMGEVADSDEQATALLNTVTVPTVFLAEDLSRENIEEDLECLLNDCSVFATALEDGDFDEPWAVNDFDNWNNMVNAIERVKKYIELNIPKQTT
jgi:antirestriction protein